MFFYDGKGVVKLDKNDVNIQEGRNEHLDITISVCFEDLPQTVVIDSTVTTSLQSEYLVNRDGRLEVIKKYKNVGTAKTYIRAWHPTNEKCSNLLLKKNADLKKLAQAYEIPCDNLAVNSVIRKAIWLYYQNDLQLAEVEIDASKEDAKVIWDKLAVYMPVFSLFQADRKNSDGDDEVQDPLKEAVKQILSDEQLQQTLSQVAEEVRNKLKDVASRTLDKLREMDPSIANSLNPIIPDTANLKWQDVFKSVSISGDEDIPINKRGSGVKRLILLNFFRAEMERRLQEGNSTGIIYAIEEPETSQHTENQKKVNRGIKNLVKY